MEIHIRNAEPKDYNAVEDIMQQVHQMHAGWRPDIYERVDPVLPVEMYGQAVREKTIFVAEYGGRVSGILLLLYRHIEYPGQVTRNIIFIDAMAVDENCRGKGIGHAFFAYLRKLKEQLGYDRIELQVNAKNEAAYKMYAAYGFTVKSVNMELL